MQWLPSLAADADDADDSEDADDGGDDGEDADDGGDDGEGQPSNTSGAKPTFWIGPVVNDSEC